MSTLPRSPVRYDVTLPVRFRTTSDLSWTDGHLANLSATGLCLLSPEADLLPGQSVELVVETTDKFLRTTARRIRAKVVWSQGGRHGIEFARRATNPFAGLSRNDD